MSSLKAKAPPELWVVFDTNSIYTGSANYLLRKEVVDLIADNSGHPDLKIHWYVPDVVRHERQYQMNRQAASFLPTIEKLERLLGHNLNITSDILELRVNEAIERQILEVGVEIEALNAGALDWQRIIGDAIYRRPPFDTGENEKGFRDVIVLETFAQLMTRAPTNPKNCRLALITADKLLLEAATARVAGASNVRLFATVDELRGLINTLVSDVDEDFVKALMPQAQKLFFAKDPASLYYASDVGTTITKRVAGEIGSLPSGANRHEITGFTIAPPQFVRKDRQRIHWSSRVDVKIDAHKRAPMMLWGSNLIQGGNVGLTISGDVTTSPKPDFQSFPNFPIYRVTSSPGTTVYDTGNILGSSESQTIASGVAAYDVLWHSVVNTARKLTRAQVDTIQFVEVVWG